MLHQSNMKYHFIYLLNVLFSLSSFLSCSSFAFKVFCLTPWYFCKKCFGPTKSAKSSGETPCWSCSLSILGLTIGLSRIILRIPVALWWTLFLKRRYLLIMFVMINWNNISFLSFELPLFWALFLVMFSSCHIKERMLLILHIGMRHMLSVCSEFCWCLSLPFWLLFLAHHCFE